MSEQITSNETMPVSRRAPVGGILLIVIGTGLLLSQLFNFEGLFPLLLGLGFLIAGVFTRKTGLFIPGGILSGVGLGTLSTMNHWFAPIDSVEQGGAFLLFFSLGWFAITAFSAIFGGETLTWPLIPGGIMALIGGLIMMGEQGLAILQLIGTYWPLILVVIGVVMIVGWLRNK